MVNELNQTNFERIKAFILEHGDRVTYCNRYNDSPHYSFGDFDVFLNPKDTRNLYSRGDARAFNELVIRDWASMAVYYRIRLDGVKLNYSPTGQEQELDGYLQKIYAAIEKIKQTSGANGETAPVSQLQNGCNSLPEAEGQQDTQAVPVAENGFSDQNNISPVTGNQAYQEMTALIRQAYHGNASASEALAYLDRALDYYRQGLVTDGYHLLYLHYSKMAIYAQLAYQTPGITPETVRKNQEGCVAEARICLELVAASFNELDFTDEGLFHREVIRYACNVLAWWLYEHHTDREGLEEALAYAARGAQFATELGYFYILDTQVRILLKLGRTDEAYSIVNKVLKQAPDFGDFSEFKTDWKYLEWAKNN